MTAQEREDGMRQEPGLSAAEKADGFAAVMKRLKSHSPDERARLRTQAEEVALGHEAYALGQKYLDRGDYEAARWWLRVAAGHHIPGAEQALEEIALRQTLDGSADFGGIQTAAGAVPCETIPSQHAPRAKDGQHRILGDAIWSSVVEQLYLNQTVAAAREHAAEITAQARRDADALLAEVRQAAAACADMAQEVKRDRSEAAEWLAEARQQAEGMKAAWAQLMLEADQDRRKAAEMLAEARQMSESVRSEVAKIDERARRRARKMRAETQGEALLVVDEAHRGAALIRRARQQVGGGEQSGYPAGVGCPPEY
ncbi:hypothetical protein OIE49_36440 [Streptomyces sp. NBC_01788]|uniref:hypothetical protein n=1 Tax=Streptomyces sp. NBC_01788 TaxID=2975940 RepID=UPI002DD7F260|nr:hypothetical protein [Streptomyces sp. NBC_01788]WSB30885.1 hypothetical protein OIE49_36440 [Streptomyces sp. NBC_01788]